MVEAKMDFSREAPHTEGLIVRGEKPFNAEPPASALVAFKYTPEELIYCRNHSAFSSWPQSWVEKTQSGKSGLLIVIILDGFVHSQALCLN